MQRELEEVLALQQRGSRRTEVKAQQLEDRVHQLIEENAGLKSRLVDLEDQDSCYKEVLLCLS